MRKTYSASPVKNHHKEKNTVTTMLKNKGKPLAKVVDTEANSEHDLSEIGLGLAAIKGKTLEDIKRKYAP